MKWKCVCSNENDMEITKCPKCKRARPSYLRIDIRPNIEFDGNVGAELTMLVVLDLFKDSEATFEKLIEEREADQVTLEVAREIRSLVVKDLKKCNKLINYLRDKFPDIEIVVDDEVSGFDSIQSSVEYLLGRINYYFENFDTAIDYLMRSYKLLPNQEALYMLALCVRSIPVDSGSTMLKASKFEDAHIIKKELEENLFLGTVDFDHKSSIGIEAGKLLIDYYGLIESIE